MGMKKVVRKRVSGLRRNGNWITWPDSRGPTQDRSTLRDKGSKRDRARGDGSLKVAEKEGKVAEHADPDGHCTTGIKGLQPSDTQLGGKLFTSEKMIGEEHWFASSSNLYLRGRSAGGKVLGQRRTIAGNYHFTRSNGKGENISFQVLP